MKKKPPLISVIIPCYNYSHFLPSAVNSVLEQTCDALTVEIIVVDDGSTDDTAAVAQRFSPCLQYIHQENQGLSAARNTGIRAATGEYLVFLDADDLLTRGTLSSHLDTFTAHPELDVSVCRCFQIVEGEVNTPANFLWPLKALHLDLHLCHSNIAPVHTFMVRSKAVREIGFFNPSFRACEDQDYWLRCAALGKRMGVNPDGLVIYRRHQGSLTGAQTQQLAHDSAIRFKITSLLENESKFPRAGKFYGWLAHAAGSINSARLIHSLNPKFALRLVEESAKAVIKAALVAEQAKTEDTYLTLAARYFAGKYLLYAGMFDAHTCQSLEKATSFLATRYTTLACLTKSQLDAKLNYIVSRLSCDQNRILARLKQA